jgi:hypothetical protein
MLPRVLDSTFALAQARQPSEIEHRLRANVAEATIEKLQPRTQMERGKGPIDARHVVTG